MKFRLIKLFIWICIIFGIVFYRQYVNIANFEIQNNQTITVEDGDTPRSILKTLWNFDAKMLSLYIKNNVWNFNLQKWTYQIYTWDTIWDVVETLKKWPETKSDKIRVIEWRNMFDIDNYLVEKWFIKAWVFINEAKNIKNYNKNYSYLTKAITLEWFLYPDTYFVNPETFSVSSLIWKMLDNFETKVYTPYLKNKSSLEIVEIVNLASIVEKEANHATSDEEKTIAWILKKRYENNWMIWADITACYNYELTEKECKMSVSKYINAKNDYNTRTKTWLPKTPILNPRVNSIVAALNPIETNYWFYLHDTQTWVAYYAKTNEEHNINKSKYIK